MHMNMQTLQPMAVAARNSEVRARWHLETEKSMVGTVYHQQNHSENKEPLIEGERLWIVEPSQDGAITFRVLVVNKDVPMLLTVAMAADLDSIYVCLLRIVITHTNLVPSNFERGTLPSQKVGR